MHNIKLKGEEDMVKWKKAAAAMLAVCVFWTLAACGNKTVTAHSDD